MLNSTTLPCVEVHCKHARRCAAEFFFILPCGLATLTSMSALFLVACSCCSITFEVQEALTFFWCDVLTPQVPQLCSVFPNRAAAVEALLARMIEDRLVPALQTCVQTTRSH
jgi:hypothetical protein